MAVEHPSDSAVQLVLPPWVEIPTRPSAAKNCPEIVNQLKAASRGNTEAFLGLFDRYCDPLNSHLLDRTGDIGLAETLTEETFSKAADSIGQLRFHHPVSFRAWLYKIARQVAEDSGPFLTPLPEKPSRIQLIMTALRTLDPNYQETILLKLIEGFDKREISVVINSPERDFNLIQYRAFISLALAVQKKEDEANRG